MEIENTARDRVTVTLLDIPWEQVLCRHVLPSLSLQTLFRLRSVSRQFRDLVDVHFSLLFTISTVSCADTFSSRAFGVLSGRNFCVKELILRNAKDWLTDASLLPVVQNNGLLHAIDLSNCRSISNASLYAIGVNCHQLRWLSLQKCVWVSSAGMLSLIVNEQPLEHVDLSGCWDLDDEAISQLVQYCRGIKFLLLNNIYGLTDRAVLAIAHLCPTLQQLSVNGCWRLTDHCITMVGELCKDLRALQVRECRNITEKSLGPLRARKVRIDKPAPSAICNRYVQHLAGLNVQI
ncbi:hypothetical protein BaRGS_00002207 [Batillaria attramentaria]|uniref:F-box/LRR-repeat protein 15-like leucin rich repeat domain-containing protein n=1 Tax=Batillaria attramentaria TaxID=370345 RepID=A0ABD0M540_9CAEN